jgi:hypothetical protein
MKMNSEIIEYYNPCYPDVPYYKCTINNVTYHSRELSNVLEFREDRIANANYYVELAKREAKAMAVFMNDVKFKD